MKRLISSLSVEELKADYAKAQALEKEQKELEEKYALMNVVFGTMYGLQKRIAEELGTRTLST